jgi:hypothetical protein
MTKRKRKPSAKRKPMPKPSRPMTSKDRRRILQRLFEAIRKAGLYE